LFCSLCINLKANSKKLKRWHIISSIIFFIAISSALLNSCRKTDVRKQPTKVEFIVPANFPQPVYNFTTNPLTKEGIDLGHKLFYEGRLSKDLQTSCSSCHQQIAAFTTYQHDRSHGYNHSHTQRNAIALSNLAWQNEFRLDGKNKSLEQVFQEHITAMDEMAETMDNIIASLKTDSKYRNLFAAAYGDENITSQRMVDALKQFVLTMVSVNSKYDKVKRGQANFDVYEEMGYTVFKARCATCHAEPLFTDFSYRNVGLPLDMFLVDYGRMRVTGNKNDSLKFRVPSLRNVEFSSYYFHDGRYSTLQKCINHYRSEVVQSATLDPVLTNGISLTDTEVINLIAFLRALSDSAYTKDTRFAQPTF
jgi:cytochrome c peroxidase